MEVVREELSQQAKVELIYRASAGYSGNKGLGGAGNCVEGASLSF